MAEQVHSGWRRGRESPHIVLCAALGRGHITPMIGLAHSLAATGAVSITVIFQIAAALESVDLGIIAGLDVEFAVLKDGHDDADPPWMVRCAQRVRGRKPSQIDAADAGSEHLPPTEFPSEEAALERLLKEMVALPSPPVCLVGDFTLPWIAAPARSCNLPRYVLYTDPANFMALGFYVEALSAAGVFPITSSTKEILVPGVPPLFPHDIAEIVWDTEHLYYPMLDLWHRRVLESDGVLMNTFYELESDAIDSLRTQILAEKPLADVLFPVGPLISSNWLEVENDKGPSAVFKSSAEKMCMQWLDTKPACSVLYISFGSWEFLPDEQVIELALGLEASGHSFLWAIAIPPHRSSSTLDSLLPHGFLDRTREDGRGFVVPGWAPQHSILRHPAVGGFLTHCGWNSVLECVSLAGIPMLCWPLIADQPTACRFLVDGLKIGVEIHEDEDGMVDRFEVDRAVRLLMEGSQAEEMRTRAGSLKESARNAVSSDKGSSKKNLMAFIERALGQPRMLHSRT